MVRLRFPVVVLLALSLNISAVLGDSPNEWSLKVHREGRRVRLPALSREQAASRLELVLQFRKPVSRFALGVSLNGTRARRLLLSPLTPGVLIDRSDTYSVRLSDLRFQDQSLADLLSSKKVSRIDLWIHAPYGVRSAKLRAFQGEKLDIVLDDVYPDGLIKDESDVEFSFSTRGNAAAVECAHNNGKFKECESPWLLESLKNGLHDVSFRARGTNGKYSATKVSRFWVQVPDPSVVITKVTPAEKISSSSSLQVEFRSKVAVSKNWKGKVTFECRVDREDYKACKSPMKWTDLSSGPHRVQIRQITWWPILGTYVQEIGGPANYRWEIQNAPLTLEWETVPAALTNNATSTFEFVASRDADFECSLDKGPVSRCQSPNKIGPVSDGDHSFEVVAVDTSGKRSSPIAHRWVVDTAAPSVSWVSVLPTGRSADPVLTAEFQANESATFACSLDGQAFGACTSPVQKSGIGEGSHRFEVRATDLAGNQSGLLTHTWTVDLSAPGLVLHRILPVESLTHSSGAKFEFSSEDAEATFLCELDGVTEECTSPYEIDGIPDGNWTFNVQARDTSGNLSAVQSSSWTIDRQAPLVDIVGIEPPQDGGISRSVSVQIWTNEPSQLQCKQDAGAWLECSNPWIVNDLSDGTHELKVRAIDLAGNMSQEIGFARTVNTIAYVAFTSIEPASALSNQNTRKFVWESEMTQEFQCKLDGAELSCSSGFTTGQLADGNHVFEVQGRNAYGELGPSARHEWTQDTVAPVVTLVSRDPASAVTANSNVRFEFSSAENVEWLCAVDGGVQMSKGQSSSMVFEQAEFTNGDHSVRCVGKDMAGNESNATVIDWTVDGLLPEVTNFAFEPNQDLSNKTSARATFAANKTVTFECQWDSGAVELCQSPSEKAGLSDGPHVFMVTAKDSLGRRSAPKAKLWTVDSKAPTVALVAAVPATHITSETVMSLQFSVSEVAEVTCQLDEGAAQSCSETYQASNLTDGSHRVRVVAKDAAGNTSTTDLYEWVVDLSPPVVQITSISPDYSPTSLTKLTVTFTVSDSAAQSFCQLDSSPAQPCASPWTVNGLTNGSHEISIYAQDASGLKSESQTFSWVVDGTELIATNISVSSVTNNGATISWTTSIPANSAVEYGVGGVFSQTSPVSPERVTVHSVRIEGLFANTLYRARGRSTDQDGRVAVSPPISFRTLR